MQGQIRCILVQEIVNLTHQFTIQDTAESILMNGLMNVITTELQEAISEEMMFQDSLIENQPDVIPAMLEECQAGGEQSYRDKIFYLMEKVDIYDPKTNTYQKVINLYDT